MVAVHRATTKTQCLGSAGIIFNLPRLYHSSSYLPSSELHAKQLLDPVSMVDRTLKQPQLITQSTINLNLATSDLKVNI